MVGITRRGFLGKSLSAAAFAVGPRAACAQDPAPAAGRDRSAPVRGAVAHGLAMHGDPLYPAGFQHFASVNPDAPKGGRLTQGVVGAFDSLNPFIVRGSAPPFIRWNVVESLMARAPDEAFTVYGLLARTVETDAARSYVAFELDPAARFSDGRPVRPQDVLFSFELLKAKGRPNLRSFYGKVARAATDGETGVRFDFDVEDRELPLILALMPVLAEHATDPARFEETGFKAPLGSGPYVVREVKPGESVTFERAPAYWGAELPVNRGNFNFDELRYDYYRDVNGQFEAFKRGLYDIRFETDPGRWSTGYDFPAARQGRVVREDVATRTPKPYSALVFNMRREIFADARVRAAFTELFDFGWVNASLYYGLCRRNGSFYDGSDLSCLGRPADPRERGLLAPYPDAVSAAVMEGRWEPPQTDGSGRDRASLRRALDLLESAGWRLDKGTLVSAAGRPMTVEIVVGTKDQERLALAYQWMLRRAGIALSVRAVDNVQFESRKQSYDFDMVPYIWVNSLSPGNEQAFYFGSQAADTPGTRNFMGLKSAAADAMIAALLKAEGEAEFASAVRALDRVLISAQFAVPLFYTPGQWLARWQRVARPQTSALSGTLAESWWATGRD